MADDFSALRGLYSSKTKAPGAGAAAARLPLAVSRARPKARKKLKGTMPSGGSTVRAVGSAIVRAPEGLKTIATEGVPAAYNYLRTSTPGEVWSDVKGGASALAEQARRDPGGTLADVLPFVGDAKAVGEMLREAALMRDAGDTEGANRLESLILPIATAGFIPEVGALAVKGARAATRGAGAAMRGADAPLAARPRYIRGQEGPFTTLEREGSRSQRPWRPAASPRCAASRKTAPAAPPYKPPTRPRWPRAACRTRSARRCRRPRCSGRRVWAELIRRRLKAAPSTRAPCSSVTAR